MSKSLRDLHDVELAAQAAASSTSYWREASSRMPPISSEESHLYAAWNAKLRGAYTDSTENASPAERGASRAPILLIASA